MSCSTSGRWRRREDKRRCQGAYKYLEDFSNLTLILPIAPLSALPLYRQVSIYFKHLLVVGLALTVSDTFASDESFKAQHTSDIIGVRRKEKVFLALMLLLTCLSSTEKKQKKTWTRRKGDKILTLRVGPFLIPPPKQQQQSFRLRVQSGYQ